MSTFRSILVAASLSAGAMSSQAAANLVTNGDFEAGNTGFSSSYAYAPSGNSTEGQYTVRANPYPWNGSFVSAVDHTSGSGQMLVANGDPTDSATVWQTTVVGLTAQTSYFFEAWVMNVCCYAGYPGGNSAAVLEFSINGTAVGTRTTSLSNVGSWEGLSTTWNSGSASTAVLSLVNRNTSLQGNDFAVDDISLSTASTVVPTVPVTAVPEPATVVLMSGGLFAMAGAYRRRRPVLA